MIPSDNKLGSGIKASIKYSIFRDIVISPYSSPGVMICPAPPPHNINLLASAMSASLSRISLAVASVTDTLTNIPTSLNSPYVELLT